MFSQALARRVAVIATWLTYAQAVGMAGVNIPGCDFGMDTNVRGV